MATITKPLALNESLNTTEQTPRNLADVLSEGLAGVAEAIERGGGAGGHEIIDSEGNTMPQEENLQFVGLKVTDDSTNGKTIVDATDKVTWEANGVLGAKNLIPYPYYHTTRTANGITWTVNDDGTVTANGTATERTEFSIRNRTRESFKLPVGEYLLSGCAPNGGVSKWAMATYYTTPSNTGANLVFDYGHTGDRPLNITNEMMSQYFTIGISLVIQSGVTVENLVFKPMIRLAEDIDDTYQPYAMTNRELTVGKAEKSDIGNVESGTTASKAYSTGELLYYNGTLHRAKVPIASGATFTVGTNVEVTNVSEQIRTINAYMPIFGTTSLAPLSGSCS